MSLGRPLEFEPETAVLAAMELFWAKGYEHTSMQDLLTVMGISKSSLYQAFGSKRLLFQRCMAHYADRYAVHMRELLANAPSGLRFIEDFLASVLEDTRGSDKRRGCLVLNTANEFAQRDSEIARDVRRSINQFRDVLQSAIERAQREGSISPSRDAKTLAIYLVSSMSGLKTLAKSGADRKALQGVIEVIMKALN